MLAILASRRRQGPQPPPAGPLVNLQQAITHMPEATPEEIDENLSAWYEMLQADTGPVDAAEAYATLCSELRSKGNPNGTGPQFLVCNPSQNQIHIISCLFQRPASIPDMPAESPFAHSPYIAVMQNRDTAQDDWVYGPITAEALFGQRTERITKWATIKKPPKNDNGKGYAQPRGGQPTDFFPVLPLYGKSICAELVQLLYPTEAEDDSRPSLKTIGHILKPYVDSIPTEATRSWAQKSLASLVTGSGDAGQVGTIPFDTAAGDVPEAKAAIKAWADHLVDRSLNPRNVSFLEHSPHRDRLQHSPHGDRLNEQHSPHGDRLQHVK